MSGARSTSEIKDIIQTYWMIGATYNIQSRILSKKEAEKRKPVQVHVVVQKNVDRWRCYDTFVLNDKI